MAALIAFSQTEWKSRRSVHRAIIASLISTSVDVSPSLDTQSSSQMTSATCVHEPLVSPRHNSGKLGPLNNTENQFHIEPFCETE